MTDWELALKKQREEEMGSVRGRRFILNLSDADVDRLFQKAADAGIYPEEILERFAGDLINGTFSQGGDERELAGQWFERSGFSWMREADFSAYLRDADLWEEAAEDVQEMEGKEESIRRYSKAIQEGRYRLPSGSVTAWEERYPKKEMWDEHFRRNIRMEGKELAKRKNAFEEDYWKPYLEHMERKGRAVAETMESQMKKLLEMKRHYERLQGDAIEEDIAEEEKKEGEDRREGDVRGEERQEQSPMRRSGKVR